MTTQERYDYACECYESVINLVEEMGEIANRKHPEVSFNINIMKKQVDCLLQTLLLEVACADNNISKFEAKFIDSITDYADVLHEIKLTYENGRPITWNTLDTLNPSDYKLLCSKANDWAEDIIFDLLKVLIYADYYSEFDYLDKFTEKMYMIARALCDMDGCYSSDEENSLLTIISKKFHLFWKNALDKLNANHNAKSTVSSNSLKSQYELKKNK